MSARSPQLASGPEPLDVAALAAAGFASVVHLAEAESTMHEARRLAAERERPLPAVVIADRQTSGRGRRGAGWWQADGSLAASLVIDGPPRPTWSLACGVALAEAIRGLEPDVDALLKWPNDLEVAGRKLAGIIVEADASGRGIFGIGINTAGAAATAPESLRDRLVTLPDLTGRSIDRTRLLAALLPRLLDLVWAIDADPPELERRYRPLCSLDGRDVTIHVGTERYHGVCRGIASDGGLVIDTPAGRKTFTTGSLTPPGTEWRQGAGSRLP
jgi:BirA family biotin operon repressor/biotin-[acetyl-CoA-carboxylase] ligase